MSFSAGEKLGPYEILAPIGAGGMGQVYRARDPRLGRDVAIKVSGAQFTERFEREARAVAALNHPNICTLFDVGANYLVMELVEGPTLADRTAAGKIPLAETLTIARQIVDALEAAHEKNIVHRDLKPANIKVKPDGTVKVLDFGLAKTAEGSATGNPENSPTLTLQDATRAGVILGTAGYMSPEQASGKPVDKRADIWAFGVVLWEMLTGRKMFAGETVSHTLAAVLIQAPDWQQLPADTPPSLKRLLKRCLERDLKRRLSDIGTARFEIEAATEEKPEPVVATIAPSRSRLVRVLATALAVAVLLIGGVSFVHFREKPPAAELMRFQFPLPPGTTLLGPLAPQEISPDGRKLAFMAVEAGGIARLWIRSLDALEPRMVMGADIQIGPLPFFWSDDSRFIAFESTDHKLKKIDVSGGPPQTLCDADQIGGGAWSRDGVILFGGSGKPLMRVSESGGTPVPVTALDAKRQENSHGLPQFLPDGRHFIYFRLSSTIQNSGFYVGSIDAKPSEQPSKPLLPNQSVPGYYVPSGNTSGGYFLFYREGTVLAQPFDPTKLALSGDPVSIAEQVGNLQGIQGFFSASTNGVLAFVGGGATGNTQLTWVDRQGKNVGTLGEPATNNEFALSPDGKQLIVSRGGSQTGASLWLYDVARGAAPARFTFDASSDGYPVWSPDGSRIAFWSVRDGPGNLYQKLTSGATNEQILLKSNETKFPYSWSRDGRYLAYSVQTAKSKDDIWILPMEGSQKAPFLFQGTDGNETQPCFSPDGHWIAYMSDASGRGPEVYVREFVLGSDGKPEPTAPHLISANGGASPQWRADGKELFYLSFDNRILSADIATQPTFQFNPTHLSIPKPLGPPFMGIAGDGQRFLIAVPVGKNAAPQFTVVLNWLAGLKK